MTREGELTGRTAILTIAAAVAIFFMGSTLLTPLYVLYGQAYGFSNAVLTLIHAVYSIGVWARCFLSGDYPTQRQAA